MKMQKILVNGESTTIEDFIEKYIGEGELDVDSLGAALDSDTVTKAIDSFTSSYSIFDFIERYLQLADKPIEVTT